MPTPGTIVSEAGSLATDAGEPGSVLSALRRKIATNWLQLFSGHMAASVLTLLSFILMSRTISVELVGVIAVIQTYWRIIEGLLSFHSFKVLISYGAEALARGDRQRFGHVVRTCATVDVAIAVLSVLVGALGLMLFSGSMNIPPSLQTLAVASGLMMLHIPTNAASGVLRLLNRFSVVAAIEVVVAAIRVAASAAGFYWSLPAEFFLVSWVAAQFVGDLLLMLLGVLVLNQDGHAGWFRAASPEKGQTRRLLRSLLVINFSSTITIASEEGDVLLVNALAGAAGAGMYRVAKNFAGILHKLAGPLANAVAPEITRLVATADRGVFNRIFKEINVTCGLLALVALIIWAVIGPTIIIITVGPQYAPAYLTVMIFMVALGVALSGLCCAPTLLALQRWRDIFMVTLACTATFFAAAAILIPRFGVDGGALAQLMAYSVEVALSLMFIRRALDQRRWTKTETQHEVRADE